MEIIKSINDNQHDIINEVIKLYNDGKAFDVDCCYSKGVFTRMESFLNQNINLI